jgi:predicted dehydrogenase
LTRIALLGAGRMGQVHLRVLDGVEVSAVVDPRKEVRAALAAGGPPTIRLSTACAASAPSTRTIPTPATGGRSARASATAPTS